MGDSFVSKCVNQKVSFWKLICFGTFNNNAVLLLLNSSNYSNNNNNRKLAVNNSKENYINELIFELQCFEIPKTNFVFSRMNNTGLWQGPTERLCVCVFCICFPLLIISLYSVALSLRDSLMQTNNGV